MNVTILSDRETVRLERLDKFWTVWRNEYLRNLSPATKFSKDENVTIGSLVLIREDNVPRLFWPIGVIRKVFQSKDSIVRSAEIETAKGIKVRAVQRLHCLEVSDPDLSTREDQTIVTNDVSVDLESEDLLSKDEVEGESRTTRSGRVINSPRFLKDFVKQ